MIMASLQEEVRMPVARGEGPVGLIVCPSRELARQTYDIIVEYSAALREGECTPSAGVLDERERALHAPGRSGVSQMRV